MEPGKTQLLDMLLDKAGLNPSSEDRKKLLPMFEIYLERLKILQAADLDDEEIAGAFTPQWSKESTV